MKDWANLIPDVYCIMNKHYTPGRYDTIRQIVIHHNGGNLTTEDCWNVWQTREASAHYQVEESGRIGQLVDDFDTAWHAGDANGFTIGIEHANNQFGPWTVSDETLENGAHLVAALCVYHGLGMPEWGANVVGHNYYMPTGCPGELGESQNAAYMERAQYWYKQMTGEEQPPMPEQIPGDAVNNAGLYYRAHVQNIGWCSAVHDGQTAGTTGFGVRWEALKCRPPAGWLLEFCFHVQNKGWQKWTCDGDAPSSGDGSSDGDPIMGSVGEALRIEDVIVRVLKRPDGDTRKLWFQVHQENIGWKAWTLEGFASGADGQSARLEAFRMKIE